MPFPAPTGYASPQTLNGSYSAGGISPEIMQMIEQENYGRMTAGQQPIEIPATNDPLQFATLLYFNNPQLAMTVAAQSGIPQEALIQNVTTTNAQNQADRRAGWNPLQRTLEAVGENIEPITAAAFLAPLALGAVGGAFGGGAAGAAGGGAASAPAAGGAAQTFPLASGGTITGSAIPGVTSGTTAAGATAAGIGPAVAGGGASGVGGNFLQNWLPTITGGANALLGAHTANSAADAESAALQSAIDEQRRQYDTTRADLQPWMTAGQGALNRLQDPNAFTASPGYQWARSEGMRDIGNSFAARGGAASGNALKALSEWQTGLAQQDYGNWWNQQAGLAGVGQTATNSVANVGQNTAGNVGNFLAGQGASRASGIWNRNASIGQGVQNATSDVYNWLQRRRVA